MNVLPVRVMVEEVWDEVYLELPGDAPVSEIKRQALEMTRVRRDPTEFVLKYRGAELADETVSLSRAGVVPNGALIVLSRRRRPVR
jgi:hypothetical protein